MMKKIRQICLLLSIILIGVCVLCTSVMAADDPITVPYAPGQGPSPTQSEPPASIKRPDDPTNQFGFQNQANPTPEWSNNSQDRSVGDTTPSSEGLFDDTILIRMHQFMRKTNDAISRVLMIGQGLMCYARYVDYTSIYKLEIPNLNFLFVGFCIFAVGVLMAFSIGMYFVDVAFKFGFAILFLPVSIALWPFPPTKNKFSDNLSIIIRNAMLFAMVGIGVSFAVKLIGAGLLRDGSEADFWAAIAEAQTEKLSESFSLFSTHILVVAFVLAYGFKLLESTVNNYLDAFFDDAVFGSESPMHLMGTQAVGLVSENVAKPALKSVKNAAMRGTGRVVKGVGKGVSKVFSSQGRSEIKAGISKGFKKIGSGFQATRRGLTYAAQNPQQAVNKTAQFARQQYNKGMQKAGAAANRAIHNAGDKVASKIGSATIQNMIDTVTDTVGNAAESTIAKGGGAVRRVVTNPRTTYNNIMHKTAQGVSKTIQGTENKVRKAYRANLDRKFERQVNKLNQQFANHEITEEQLQSGIQAAEQERIEKIANFKGKADKVAQKTLIASAVIAHGGGAVKAAAAEKAKQGIAAAGAKLHNMNADEKNKLTPEQVREKLHQKREEYQTHRAEAKARKEQEKARKAQIKELKEQEAKNLQTEKTEHKEGEKVYKRAEAQRKKEEAQRKKEENLQRAQEELRRAEEELQRAEEELRRSEEETRRAVDNSQKINTEERAKTEEQLRIEVEKARMAAEVARVAVKKAQRAVDNRTIMGDLKEYYKDANNAPITLAPTQGLKTAFNLVRHPQRTMQKLADNWESLQNVELNQNIILKKSGQIVIRSIKDTGRDLTDGVGSRVGMMLQKFGDGLIKNGSQKQQRKSIFDQINEQREEKERARRQAEDDRLYWQETHVD